MQCHGIVSFNAERVSGSELVACTISVKRLNTSAETAQSRADLRFISFHCIVCQPTCHFIVCSISMDGLWPGWFDVL